MENQTGPANTSATQVSPYVMEMWLTYVPVVYSVAFVVNMLSLVILLSKRMRTFSCCHYLAALAATDICFTVLNLSAWLTHARNFNVINYTVLCQVYQYGSKLCETLSSWYILMACIDRYVGVATPSRASVICSVFRARIIALVLWVVAVVLNTFYSTVYVTDDGNSVCALAHSVATSNFYRYFYKWFYLIYSCSLPAIATLVFSILIIKEVTKVRLCQHGRGLIEITMTDDIAETPCSSSASAELPAGSADVARMVVVAAILRTVVYNPYKLWAIQGLHEQDGHMWLYFVHELGPIVPPIVYFLASKHIRRTFMKSLRRRSNSKSKKNKCVYKAAHLSVELDTQLSSNESEETEMREFLPTQPSNAGEETSSVRPSLTLTE